MLPVSANKNYTLSPHLLSAQEIECGCKPVSGRQDGTAYRAAALSHRFSQMRPDLRHSADCQEQRDKDMDPQRSALTAERLHAWLYTL